MNDDVNPQSAAVNGVDDVAGDRPENVSVDKLTFDPAPTAVQQTPVVDFSFPSIEQDDEQPKLIDHAAADIRDIANLAVQSPVIEPTEKDDLGAVDTDSDAMPVPDVLSHDAPTSVLPPEHQASTDIPVISIPPIAGQWALDDDAAQQPGNVAATAGADGATDAVSATDSAVKDGETVVIGAVPGAAASADAHGNRVASNDAVSVSVGQSSNGDHDRVTAGNAAVGDLPDDAETRILPPIPPVPTPPLPQSLPLNPGVGEATGDAADDADTEFAGSSNVIAANPEDFTDAGQETTVIPPTAVAGAQSNAGTGIGAASNAGTASAVAAGKPFNTKLVIGGIVAVAAVVALSAGGAYAWNNHQAGQTQAQKLVACQAAYKKYQDAADALQSALGKTSSAQKVTKSQVADATTVTTLASAVKDAKALDAVEECGTNATVSALTTQTAAANDAADSATKLASSLTKAADAVTASQTKKTDADRDKAKKDLQTAVADAQTLLDNTAGAVMDESTRDALQTALDTANGLLKEDKPNMQSLQDALKALQTASDDVNASAEALTAYNAQVLQNNGTQDTMPITPQSNNTGTTNNNTGNTDTGNTTNNGNSGDNANAGNGGGNNGNADSSNTGGDNNANNGNNGNNNSNGSDQNNNSGDNGSSDGSNDSGDTNGDTSDNGDTGGQSDTTTPSDGQ